MLMKRIVRAWRQAHNRDVKYVLILKESDCMDALTLFMNCRIDAQFGSFDSNCAHYGQYWIAYRMNWKFQVRFVRKFFNIEETGYYPDGVCYEVVSLKR